MKRLLILFSAIILHVSCSDTRAPKKPENLLSKDRMVGVIVDISLLNAAKGINKRTIEDNGLYPLDYVYKKHQIDSLQFAQSNSYYSYFINDYEAIYTRAKDSLEQLKSIYKDIQEQENIKTRKTDSLKKAKRRDSLRWKKTKLLDNSIKPKL